MLAHTGWGMTCTFDLFATYMKKHFDLDNLDDIQAWAATSYPSWTIITNQCTNPTECFISVNHQTTKLESAGLVHGINHMPGLVQDKADFLCILRDWHLKNDSLKAYDTIMKQRSLKTDNGFIGDILFISDPSQ